MMPLERDSRSAPCRRAEPQTAQQFKFWETVSRFSFPFCHCVDTCFQPWLAGFETNFAVFENSFLAFCNWSFGLLITSF